MEQLAEIKKEIDDIINQKDDGNEEKEMGDKKAKIGVATYQDTSCKPLKPPFKKYYREHGQPVFGSMRQVVAKKIGEERFTAMINKTTTWIYPKQQINAKRAYITPRMCFNFTHDLQTFLWVVDMRMLTHFPSEEKFDAGFGLTIEDWS